MKIYEGYAVVAYDYKVDRAQDCLFDMKDTLVQKELRMLKKSGFESNRQPQYQDMFKKIIDQTAKGYDQIKNNKF